VALLPAGFPAAVLVNLHRSDSYDVLERVLSRRSPLPIQLAADRARLAPGQVYVAPHDRQLVIGQDLRLSILGSGNWVRQRFPDALLASAARAFGARLIGVVLSGRMEGGARGVRAVKRGGGRVLVEDPRTAIMSSMPNAALATGCVDFALPPEGLGHALVALCAASGAAELFRVRMNTSVSG
jgi:two-component system chemotaxis response regulator CheB